MQRIGDNVARMEWLARELLGRARAEHAQIDGFGLDALLADAVGHEISLSPFWYADAA
jgi:hypothetical protein